MSEPGTGELAGTRWKETKDDAQEFAEECPLEVVIYEVSEGLSNF